MSESRGPLVVIGGHEDREGEKVILREVADHLRGGKLLVCAAASEAPQRYIAMYRTAFADLSVDVVELDASTATTSAADGAGGVFFTGGNQNRLVERIGGTRAERAIHELWEAGGVIAGTSAGASAMGATMLVRGPSDETPTDDGMEIGSGLGLIAGALIDQHFAERGRFGRLATSISTRPDLLGIGIDEGTAIVITGTRCRVVGVGGVYVMDASGSVPEEGLCLHLLTTGGEFDLDSRRQRIAAIRGAA